MSFMISPVPVTDEIKVHPLADYRLSRHRVATLGMVVDPPIKSYLIFLIEVGT